MHRRRTRYRHYYRERVAHGGKGAGERTRLRVAEADPKHLRLVQKWSVVVTDLRPDRCHLVKYAQFLRFAHWDSPPRGCRPYRSQLKSKVEPPIYYILLTRKFAGDADLN